MAWSAFARSRRIPNFSESEIIGADRRSAIHCNHRVGTTRPTVLPDAHRPNSRHGPLSRTVIAISGRSEQMTTNHRNGGYDEGYRACPCFWGTGPGSVLAALEPRIDYTGANVLDLGCGEGKNAAWLAARGAAVDAIDISPHALANAARTHGGALGVTWKQGDAADVNCWALPDHYDVSIAYGLMHCLDAGEIEPVIEALKLSTRQHGYAIVVAFNSRSQNIEAAHPGFEPTLFSHERYISFFDGWELILQSDADLHETHPHNGIPHTHSMTRLAARRPRNDHA